MPESVAWKSSQTEVPDFAVPNNPKVNTNRQASASGTPPVVKSDRTRKPVSPTSYCTTRPLCAKISKPPASADVSSVTQKAKSYSGKQPTTDSSVPETPVDFTVVSEAPSFKSKPPSKRSKQKSKFSNNVSKPLANPAKPSVDSKEKSFSQKVSEPMATSQAKPSYARKYAQAAAEEKTSSCKPAFQERSDTRPGKEIPKPRGLLNIGNSC